MRVPVWLPLLLLLPAAEVLPAKWVSVVDGMARAVYLDAEGMLRDGNQVRAWTREVYTEEQRSRHTGALYYSANSLMRFDCSRRTSVPVLQVLYGSDGTELRRIGLDAVELPTLVPPGSVQEHLLDRACRPQADKRPADGPTKVALAQTKPKTDVPAAEDVAKPAAAEGAAKTPESKATESKPAVVPKVVPEAAKRPEATKAVSPQTVPSKFVERKPPSIEPRHPVVRPLRLALVKPKKEHKKDVHAEGDHIHWSYDGKGAPQNWGGLKPEFAACQAGKRQSPIDIQDGARLDLEPIKFDYRPSPLRIIDNGHTVQVNFSEGSSISVSGIRYDLKQFHFHKPSEERVNGKVYDMVIHLVHQSNDGRLAVVAVLMETGLPNAFIGSLWPYLPLESGREISLPEVMVDVNTLLPESRNYYTYMGSLTTPPCTEGVLWLVMKNSVSVAAEQVGIFGKLYSMNARPAQPANGRLIKESL